MAENARDLDRRRYPRLKRPVFYRLPSFFDRWKSVHDVGIGGCRIYTDEKLRNGKELILDILLPDGTTVHARASVVWTARLPEGSPAEWEVGIQFFSLPDGGIDVLREYLERPPEPHND